MNSTGDNREEKALDALIAAAFLPELKTEKLSDAELCALAAAKLATLPEDKAVLLARGNPFAQGYVPKPVAGPAHCSAQAMVVAMNRKNETDKQSAQTRAELERKTRELLG